VLSSAGCFGRDWQDSKLGKQGFQGQLLMELADSCGGGGGGGMKGSSMESFLLTPVKISIHYQYYVDKTA